MGARVYYSLVWLQVADMLVNADSAYYLKGKYHDEIGDVLTNYLKTNFVSDALLLALILLDQRVWSYLLLLYFYKLVPFQSIVKRIEESFYFNNRIVQQMRLLRLLCFVIFVSHVFSCFWMILARNESYSWLSRVPFETNCWQHQVTNFLYSVAHRSLVGGEEGITELRLCVCIYNIIDHRRPG